MLRNPAYVGRAGFGKTSGGRGIDVAAAVEIRLVSSMATPSVPTFVRTIQSRTWHA
jgi:hypothetical protein